MWLTNEFDVALFIVTPMSSSAEATQSQIFWGQDPKRYFSI